MYKRILVATDGSKLSSKAVTHAIALARTTGAQLVAFHASPDQQLAVYGDGFIVGTMPSAEYKAAAAKAAEKILERVAREAGKADVKCTTAHAIAVEPWRAILDQAKKSKADAIVMASHGRRGVSALLVGSETQKVLTHSKLPVTVVR
jgi:nucleotide-binding universal stress UspA family protein